jgi:hypothetical protein
MMANMRFSSVLPISSKVHSPKKRLVEQIRRDPGTLSTRHQEYASVMDRASAHFIISIDFTSQNTPLTPTDLSTLYLHLRAAKKANSPYFAFYNCKSVSYYGRSLIEFVDCVCNHQAAIVQEQANHINTSSLSQYLMVALPSRF